MTNNFKNFIFMSYQQFIDEAVIAFEKTTTFLAGEFGKLQAGRANANLVDDIKVEAYGATQPIRNVASISITDSKTIRIEPWDKSLGGAIEKGILEANIGLTPSNQGTHVLLILPPLTEERRRDIVKIVHKMAEDAKISIRQARQDSITGIKNLKSNGDISEDDIKAAENKLQAKVDEANRKVDEMMKKKEQDIMTV